MKLFMVLLGILLMVNPGFAEENVVLKTEKDKVSYAIGMDIGKNLKRQQVELNPDIVSQGIKDSLSEGKTLLTEQEYIDTLTAFKKEIQQKQIAQKKEMSEKNKKEGEEFLAENGKKEGIVTTQSGLQYKVLQEGTGEIPKSTDAVTVNYRGTLIDGTEFDSSYRRGQPASFKVNGVIRGWTEALQLMKEGAKWQLYIPSNLAYGDRGAGRNIGPNSTLIFEVELISIN
ncbi:MAG: FKBP-type peptidyl-prolyl cis-trans isomerase [Nitrospiraceae bacterium]|nr:MAG: FKBP-type peptidyl-prolyl cis-trans isomerase [Nitrospiraceae bacterium]